MMLARTEPTSVHLELIGAVAEVVCRKGRHGPKPEVGPFESVIGLDLSEFCQLTSFDDVGSQAGQHVEDAIVG